MDLNAIAQATQTQPSTPVAQDSGNGTTADMFAYLLKHSFGSNVSKHTMMNTQAMLDMVNTVQSSAPLPQVNQAPPAPTQQNSGPVQSNQAASSGNTNTQQAGNQTSAANTNTDTSNSGQQANNGPAQKQQSASNTTTANSASTQTTTTATTAQASTNTGADETTEETAAVLAAAVYVVQQQTAPVATVQAIAATTNSTQGSTGPQQQGPNPTGNDVVGQAIRQVAAAAQDDEAADQGPVWSANFLNSSATTPQMVQQAQGLSQITGQSGANISVQTTTGNTNTASSASTLVPDAVMAIPSFFSGSQQDASTGGDANDDSNGQQSNDNLPQDLIDTTNQTIAQDLQALSAISALLQNAAQAAVGVQQAQGASVAAASGVSSAAAEAALPQTPATAPSAPNANASNFVSQLQEAEEPEQPQATKPLQLPAAIDAIKMQIEKGLQAGSSTIKVQLNPENMGRVDVKLDVQNGTVKATITADRPETLALLKSDQSGMLQALTDAGLNADSSSLSFYLRGDQQRQFAQSGRQGRGASGNGAAGIDSIAAVDSTSGTSAAGAASSALDISV